MSNNSTPAGYTGSQNKLYNLVTVFQGHTGPLTCLSAMDDGKLASGGVDGVRIWNLNSFAQLERPSGAGYRGATTALAWVRREDEPDDGLVYGTANGFLVCWKECQGIEDKRSFEETHCVQTATPGEITGIAFEAESNRLATSNRNSLVQVFRVGSKMDLHHIYSVVIKDHLPKAVAFGQAGEQKDILTFGLYDGLIHTLKGADGTVQSTRSIGCMIGNAVVNAKRGVFCLDDPLEGVGLYRLDSGARIRTYKVVAKKTPRPRQVTFAEDCSIILSASDHGAVYIFDRRGGHAVDVLKAGEDRIEAITAIDVGGVPYILAAISHGVGEASDIIMWQKVHEKPLELEPTEFGRNTRYGFKDVLHVIMWAVTIAFIWQNLGVSVGIFRGGSDLMDNQLELSFIWKLREHSIMTTELGTRSHQGSILGADQEDLKFQYIPEQVKPNRYVDEPVSPPGGVLDAVRESLKLHHTSGQIKPNEQLGEVASPTSSVTGADRESLKLHSFPGKAQPDQHLPSHP